MGGRLGGSIPPSNAAATARRRGGAAVGAFLASLLSSFISSASPANAATGRTADISFRPSGGPCKDLRGWGKSDSDCQATCTCTGGGDSADGEILMGIIRGGRRPREKVQAACPAWGAKPMRLRGGKKGRKTMTDVQKLAKWHRKFPLGMALYDASGGIDPASDGSTFLPDVNATLVASLLKRGPGQYSPLHFAASRGSLPVCKLLVEAGANVNASNKWEWTPLHCAATCGHTDVVEYLARKGADVFASTTHCNTPLDEATGMQHWVTASKLKRLMGPDWYSYARKSYHEDPRGEYVYDRMETVTDDELAIYWQSLHRMAKGNAGLENFIARINATVTNPPLSSKGFASKSAKSDDEVGMEIEIDQSMRDEIGWIGADGEYHLPPRRTRHRSEILGGGGDESVSTDSEIRSTEDQEGEGEDDREGEGASLGEWEESERVTVLDENGSLIDVRDGTSEPGLADSRAGRWGR